MKRILPIVLAGFCIFGPAALSAQELADQIPAGEPMLHPGDMVRIAVLGRHDLTGEFMVSGDGTIRTPAYQNVRVAGMSLGEAEANVRAFLQSRQPDPQFIIEPLFRVAVGGGVTSPSLYPLPPETTIAQAVATAGGAKTTGRLNRVVVYRGGQKYLVDLTEASTIASVPIRSGDQIIVTERVPRLEFLEDASTLLSVVVSAINLFVLVQNLN